MKEDRLPAIHAEPQDRPQQRSGEDELQGKKTPDRLRLARDRWLGKVVADGPSPAGNWLGFTLVDAGRGTVTVSVPLKKEMCNPYGNIHGGMMSLIMDETIGWAVVSLDAQQHYTSMNLVVDFLYAAAEGETLTAKSRVIRQGKKVVHAECEVFDSKGTLLAKGSSNLIATSMSLSHLTPDPSPKMERGDIRPGGRIR